MQTSRLALYITVAAVMFAFASPVKAMNACLTTGNWNDFDYWCNTYFSESQSTCETGQEHGEAGMPVCIWDGTDCQANPTPCELSTTSQGCSDFNTLIMGGMCTWSSIPDSQNYCPDSEEGKNLTSIMTIDYSGYGGRPVFHFTPSDAGLNACTGGHYILVDPIGQTGWGCNVVEGNPSKNEYCWNYTWPVTITDHIELVCNGIALAESTTYSTSTSECSTSTQQTSESTSSTFFGTFTNSFSIGYSSPTQSLITTSTFQDFSNLWLGSASNTIPGCYIHSMFGLFDFFKAITSGELESQSLHFTIGSSTMEMNLGSITYPPELEHTKLIFWNIFAVVGFLGICWIAFRDFTSADDNDDEDE